MEVLLHGGTQLNGWRSPPKSIKHSSPLSAYRRAPTPSPNSATTFARSKPTVCSNAIGRAYCYRLSDCPFTWTDDEARCSGRTMT